MTLFYLPLLFAVLGQGYAPEREIKRLLETQQADWNRGDIDAFMKGYEPGDSLIFTSGARIHRGWDAALRRYKSTYGDREAMGQLEFSNLEITILNDTAAVVLGTWNLQRRNDSPQGVFTLVLRKGSQGWKIIHDHTSSSPPVKR